MLGTKRIIIIHLSSVSRNFENFGAFFSEFDEFDFPSYPKIIQNLILTNFFSAAGISSNKQAKVGVFNRFLEVFFRRASTSKFVKLAARAPLENF